MAQAEDFVRFDETINGTFKTIINKTLRRAPQHVFTYAAHVWL